MALAKHKTKLDRIATPKQLISNKENFFIFRLKGLISNTNQMLFIFREENENLENMRLCIKRALSNLTVAEAYFKEYQKQRIQKDKEGEKK